MSDDLRILFASFAEAQAGIDRDLMFLDARLPRAMHCRFQINADGAHQIFQRRQLGPGLRVAAHVIDDQPGIVFGDDFRQLQIQQDSARDR